MSSERFGNLHYRPTSCIAQLLLTGTSGWALKHLQGDTYFVLGAFSFILGHSLIGTLNFGHPNSGKIIQKLFDQTSLIAEVVPLSLLNTELYLIAGVQKEYAFAHLIAAALPLLTRFITEEHNDKIMDAVILGNVASLTYYAVQFDTGPWAGGLAVLTTLNHFVFKKLSSRYDVPKSDIVALGLSFFQIFALYCICDAK